MIVAKQMMDDHTSAPTLCSDLVEDFTEEFTEELTEEEIAQAYEDAVTHHEEFLSESPGGIYLRNEALKHFEQRHPECKDIESFAIQADLEYDIDVMNAYAIKLTARDYAHKLLSNYKER